MTSVGSALVNRYNVAEVATFTTTAPVNSDTWTHVPVLGAPMPDLTMDADEASEANTLGASSLHYPTVRKSALAVTTRIHTGSKGFDGSGGDADPTTPFLALMLKSLFNSAPSAAFTGTTAAAAGGPGRTTPLKVTSATNLAVGMALMWEGEIAFIKGISGTDITLNRDFSATPANLDPIYGAFNYSLTLGDAATYLYQLVERDGHSWLLGPGQVMNGKISGLAAGAGLRYELGFEGNTFASGFAPSTFTPSVFTDSPVIAKAGQVYIDNTARLITDGSLDFGFLKEWRQASSTTNTTEGKDVIEVVGHGTPSMTLKPFYAAADWTKYLARTAFEFMAAYTVGSTDAAKARGAVAWYMPNCQMTTKEGTAQNQVASEVTISGRDPQTTGSVVSAYTSLTKPIYFAVFGGR